MNKEEISEVIRECDAYIEDLKKFRQGLEIVMELDALTPEAVADWEERMREAVPDSPLVEAILNLVPEKKKKAAIAK